MPSTDRKDGDVTAGYPSAKKGADAAALASIDAGVHLGEAGGTHHTLAMASISKDTHGAVSAATESSDFFAGSSAQGGSAVAAATGGGPDEAGGKVGSASGPALLALQPPPGPMPAVEALLTVETLPLLLASLLTTRGYSDVNLPSITARIAELKAQASAALASSSSGGSSSSSGSGGQSKASAALVKAQAEHWVNSHLAAVHGLERERRGVEVKMEGAMRALADCVSCAVQGQAAASLRLCCGEATACLTSQQAVE